MDKLEQYAFILLLIFLITDLYVILIAPAYLAVSVALSWILML